MRCKVEVQGFPTSRRTSKTEQYKYFSVRLTPTVFVKLYSNFILLHALGGGISANFPGEVGRQTYKLVLHFLKDRWCHALQKSWDLIMDHSLVSVHLGR